MCFRPQLWQLYKTCCSHSLPVWVKDSKERTSRFAQYCLQAVALDTAVVTTDVPYLGLALLALLTFSAEI